MYRLYQRIDRIHSILLSSVLIVCLAAVVRPAAGQTAAISLQPTTIGVGDPWSFGWLFTVNQPISVTALGWWDGPNNANGFIGDGFLTQHHVGIFDVTSLGNPQDVTGESPIVDSTLGVSSSILVEGFRYNSVQSTLLQAGHEYLIGGTNGPEGTASGADPYFDGSTVSTNVPITYHSAWVGISTTLAANYNIGPYSDLAGPNFLTSPVSVSVPEPGAYALFASLGVIGGAFLRRRRAR